jgi:hypothetical protein
MHLKRRVGKLLAGQMVQVWTNLKQRVEKIMRVDGEVNLGLFGRT